MTARRESLLRVVAFLVLAMVVSAGSAQDVRPVRDDIGFCWDRGQMERLMTYLESHEVTNAEGERIVAGISPHDDYLYAARVYFPLFRALRTKEVVIFGVTHGTVRKEIGDPHSVLILDSFPKWRGVLGEIEPSPLRARLTSLLPPGRIQVNNSAHSLEHSIEALLPFAQYYNPGIKITPIMITAMPFDTMVVVADTLSALIARYIQERGLVLGTDIAFLISSDANHYGADFNNTPFGADLRAHEEGTELDRKLASEYLVGDISREKIRELTERIWGKKYTDPNASLWCGRYSVPFGMLATLDIVHRVTNSGYKGKLLRYSDTYSEGVLPLTQTGMGLTAPFSLKHWVGFFSVAFVPDR